MMPALSPGSGQRSDQLLLVLLLFAAQFISHDYPLSGTPATRTASAPQERALDRLMLPVMGHCLIEGGAGCERLRRKRSAAKVTKPMLSD
jgi:hypothetical protein